MIIAHHGIVDVCPVILLEVRRETAPIPNCEAIREIRLAVQRALLSRGEVHDGTAGYCPC